jgi:hypothetical protein
LPLKGTDLIVGAVSGTYPSNALSLGSNIEARRCQFIIVLLCKMLHFGHAKKLTASWVEIDLKYPRLIWHSNPVIVSNHEERAS